MVKRGLEQHDRYYSVREVSEKLGVVPETVQRWIRSGELPALQFGGRMGYRVPSGELERFMRERVIAAEVSRRASAE